MILDKKEAHTTVTELRELTPQASASSIQHHNPRQKNGVEIHQNESESDDDIEKENSSENNDISNLEYTEKEEKNLLRKYDTHVLSFLCILYMLSHMDRTNIGNAHTAGMSEDLEMTSSQYQLILNFFYIGYICFQWCILLWKSSKPRVFVPFVIIIWGTISAAQGAVTNWKQLLATRYLLGAFEAAFSPGIYYYFSFFYHRHEMAKRVGLFQSFSPISSSFTGAIAYAITSHASSEPMAPWRLLFVVEGIPSILCGFIAFYAIYNGPHDCRFLTPREKLIAKARTYKQAGKVDRGGSSLNYKEVFGTFKDPKIWFHTLLYFAMNVASVPIPIFLPTILAGIGYTSINAQGMSALPYLVAVVAILVTCYLSDKYTQRAYAIIACCATAIVGYVLLAVCKTEGARYFGLFLAVPGVYTSHAIIMTWTGDNQGTDSKRGAGYVILHIFGLTGPILGTRLFPKTEAPHYLKGIWITVGFISFTLVLSAVYRVYLMRENKKLDKKHGTLTELAHKSGEEVDIQMMRSMCMDEKSPMYRYIL